MRAVTIDRFGGPEELHLTDVPEPTPGTGEVLVRLDAAGVNPIDYKMRDGSSGAVQSWDANAFPAVLGREGTGVVTAVGEGVTHVAPGDRVVGIHAHGATYGTYAELTVFPGEGVARVAESVPTAVAAGLSLAGLTAWNAVHDLGRVTNDDIVVIHGAGGGVGQIITQLAVATGAQVYATASGRHEERLEEYGAQHIDYTEVDFRRVTPRPTVITDGVWFGTYEPSMDHLAEGGRMVILPTLADLGPARERGIDVSVASISPSRERLATLADMVARHRLDIHVGVTFPLAEAADAHRYLETGHAEGKVVLAISERAEQEAERGIEEEAENPGLE